MSATTVDGIITQKGIFPATTCWVGYFWIGYAILAALSNSYFLLKMAIQTYSGFETITVPLSKLYEIGAVVFMMLLLGLLSGGLFPS